MVRFPTLKEIVNNSNEMELSKLHLLCKMYYWAKRAFPVVPLRQRGVDVYIVSLAPGQTIFAEGDIPHCGFALNTSCSIGVAVNASPEWWFEHGPQRVFEQLNEYKECFAILHEFEQQHIELSQRMFSAAIKQQVMNFAPPTFTCSVIRIWIKQLRLYVVDPLNVKFQLNRLTSIDQIKAVIDELQKCHKLLHSEELVRMYKKTHFNELLSLSFN
jgi:hypothetical protein